MYAQIAAASIGSGPHLIGVNIRAEDWIDDLVTVAGLRRATVPLLQESHSWREWPASWSGKRYRLRRDPFDNLILECVEKPQEVPGLWRRDHPPEVQGRGDPGQDV